jgi:molybdopterin molybdotransferase
MRSPAEAIADILGRTRGPLESERVPLDRALGRVLAADVVSDVDLPPFEKSAMDGYALRSAEARPGARLALAGESRAGASFAGGVPPGTCVAIFTGAELPRECDAVVMIERTRREGEEIVLEGVLRPGTNVNHRAEVLARGRAALAAPRRISPADVAVLAAVGCDPVPVWRRPRAAVFATGDELVDVKAVPGPAQIREGNSRYLAAALEACGVEVARRGLLADRPDVLADAFSAALAECDALITTGGVSVGTYDLVGAALERIGVEPVLHRVAIKPGKPIWFGVREHGGRAAYVFGLPGNPVSSLLGFEVFVRPALAKLAGAPERELVERLEPGRWSGPPVKPDERQNNLPAVLRWGVDGVRELEPLAYLGSADIAALTEAAAMAVVPPGEGLATGARVMYRPLATARQS